tara:strand:- start:6698 stop:7003 length:306 start_codon:yes stop_codon:yes gene_type:complete
MATDLTTLNWSNGGANYTQGSVGTTWLEIKLPKWAKLVTIHASAQAIYFAYDGTDGGTPGTHKFPQAVDSIIQYNPMQTTIERSIFVASQSGTATINLIFE